MLTEKNKGISSKDRPLPESLGIVLYPEPVLKKSARPVEAVDAWVKSVIQRMVEIMVEEKGVGLAAPQVGLSLRMFVASPTGKPEDARAYINPEISQAEGKEDGEEGCLSLPDIRAKIARNTVLRVEAIGLDGERFVEELTDYPARIIQHENDHLNGVLILDRMSPMARMANRKKVKELEERVKPKKKK